MKITLPFWLSGKKITQLKNAALSFWTKVETWLHWPLTQIDPDTCTEDILDLLAFQRKISRFEDEPLSLYRLRVKYAFVNAKDAGSVAGFQRIFQRLGIGYIEIRERLPQRDWDIIAIRLSNQDVWINNDLIKTLIKDYGRTCRRYEFESVIIGESTLKIATSAQSYVVNENNIHASAEVAIHTGITSSVIKRHAYVINQNIGVTL